MGTPWESSSVARTFRCCLPQKAASAPSFASLPAAALGPWWSAVLSPPPGTAWLSGRSPGLVVACSSHTRTRSYRVSSRSEEHTSELQSRLHLVCRLLLEKKKIQKTQKSRI